jgi:hypothetical protein
MAFVLPAVIFCVFAAIFSGAVGVHLAPAHRRDGIAVEDLYPHRRVGREGRDEAGGGPCAATAPP